MQSAKKPLPLLKGAPAKDCLLTYVFAIVVMLGVQVLSSVLVSVVNLASGTDLSKNVYVNLCFMVLIQLGYFLAAYFVLGRKSLKPAYSIRQRPPLFASLFSVLLAFVCLVSFIGLQFLFAQFLEKINYTFHPLAFDSPLQIVLGTLVVCVIAPVTEEIVFRGALLSGLKQVVKTPAAVLLSGLAFSLMHMNPEQTVYQFFLGCVCAYAVIASGKLFPAVVLHSASNLLAVLIDYTPLGNLVERFLALLSGNIALGILFPLAMGAVGSVALFYLIKLMRIISVKLRKRRGRASCDGEHKSAAAEGADSGAQQAQDGLKESAEVLKASAAAEKAKNKRITALCLAAGMIPCAFMWVTMFLSSVFIAA